MINNMRVLALIPARGGSKGIPNKNIKAMAGKPLISYTIVTAKMSKYIDNIVVTTDSEEIARIARQYEANIPILRPKELATDFSPTIDAVVHMIEFLNKNNQSYEILVLLQPTSPLRSNEDIDAALEKFVCRDMSKGLVSVSSAIESPNLIRKYSDEYLEPIIKANSTIRRQDMKKYVVVNGAIYINLVKDINKNLSFNDNRIPYLMEQDNSIDIDDMYDWEKAENVLASRG